MAMQTETSGPRRKLPAVVALGGLLIGWACISKFGPWPQYVLPGPGSVLKMLVHMTRDGELARAVAPSLYRLFACYALSVGAGIPLGVLMARVGWLRVAVGPLVVGLQ